VTARIRAQLRRTTLQAQKERTQARFRDAELDVLRERTQREALQVHAKLAADLHKSNMNLERACTELRGTQLQLIQSAKMSSLSKLASGIVHEVNNPLTFVFMHMETVIDSLDKLKEDFGEHLSEAGVELLENSRQRAIEARAGADRVADIVKDLRLFSNIGEGKFQNTDIAGSINSALKLNSYHIKGRKITTDVRFAEDNWLNCAPGILNQVFINLLSNAIDAVEDGGTVRIRTGRDEGIYWISIADNGPGVPEEIRERIFEPFFTTKDVGEGTGLGLPVTCRIIAQHRGTIQLRDSDTGGAEFHIRLPTDLEEIHHDDQLR
jgi:two-component system NtrC family sensor kinase